MSHPTRREPSQAILSYPTPGELSHSCQRHLTIEIAQGLGGIALSEWDSSPGGGTALGGWDDLRQLTAGEIALGVCEISQGDWDISQTVRYLKGGISKKIVSDSEASAALLFVKFCVRSLSWILRGGILNVRNYFCNFNIVNTKKISDTT